jgi:hypothetical protein
MINIANQVAFLRTTREFPEELHQLTVEVNKTYVDIANAVNNRTISIFPTGRSVLDGESWFLNSSLRQQGLRQVYTFTGTTAINIGFKFSSIAQFSPKCYGTFTDGTNWYGLIYGSNVAVAGQISFFIAFNGSSTLTDQIVFAVGAGAPAITKGTIILEWLSKV